MTNPGDGTRPGGGLIESLRLAVQARPQDVLLRVHLAERLLEAGDTAGAVAEAAAALGCDPDSAAARNLMLQALGTPGASGPTTAGPDASRPEAAATRTGTEPAGRRETRDERHEARTSPSGRPTTEDTANTANTANTAETRETAETRNTEDADDTTEAAAGPEDARDAPAGPTIPETPEFDWEAAEEEVGGIVGSRFVEPGGPREPRESRESREPVSPEAADGDGPEPEAPAYETERPTLSLADVGGMDSVKERLQVAFLAPMRNPELRRLYKKSLSGGLLLYGPPGCGKTFIARAIAGELGAHFIAIGISQVLDMYIGNSERNLHELFVLARRRTPCVLFLDEVDALGQRRSQTRSSAMRGVVNQLLLELDNVDKADSGDDGVFVLAATNQPWDVDPALRRPGRFDRTVLVLPPDAPARRATLEYHLRDRPIENIDLADLVARTDGFSGADLAHLCETAAEQALIASARTGEVRMIGMPDFETAFGEVRPSTGAWLESARGAAMFANEGGVYDDLLDYLRQRKLI